jgi:hypothetical protein
MPPRDPPAFSKQATIAIGLTVVGFMAFGLILSLYRNVLFEDTLRRIEEENDQIAEDIEARYAELEYYRSEQYKDKFAKENLNRVNVGEKMLVMMQGDIDAPLGDDTETVTEKERRETAYVELLRQMPVIEHWELFLFSREKIEEMKRGL